MGKLTMNVGPMFSGKTTALQQQGEKHIRHGHKVIFLKYLNDTRYSKNYIVSHNGVSVKAKNILDTIYIEEVLSADIILIDEVQFLPISIIDEVWRLLAKGKTIYCSGLDMDFRGKGFETTMELLAIADKVNKFSSVCKCCGADATMSSKKVDDNQIVDLGAEEKYFPTCRTCFLIRKQNSKTYGNMKGKGEEC